MTVIRASVHRAKDDKVCSDCNHLIKKGRRYIRLFGGFESDPPYELIKHLTCLNGTLNEKPIAEALVKAKIEFLNGPGPHNGYIDNIVDPENR